MMATSLGRFVIKDLIHFSENINMLVMLTLSHRYNWLILVYKQQTHLDTTEYRVKKKINKQTCTVLKLSHVHLRYLSGFVI